MELAPIVLFVYNRPDHTRKTLEALIANQLADQSELFIFSDGPKEDADEKTLADIEEVRKIAREKNWCGKVFLIESKINKGLANSVIDGITEIVSRYGKIIVLEDDLITSDFFLVYINKALEFYKDAENIYSINAYMYPIQTARNETILLPYTSTWGWGTWQRRWDCFEKDSELSSFIAENEFLKQRFNLASYDYASILINGKNSWGIHWYFSVFRRNGLCVFPTKSLIQNIGFDGTGINCSKTSFEQCLSKDEIFIRYLDQIDLNFYNEYLKYFQSQMSTKNSYFNNLKSILTKILHKINV